MQQFYIIKMVGIKPPSQQRFGGFLLPILLSENLSEKLKLWYSCK